MFMKNIFIWQLEGLQYKPYLKGFANFSNTCVKTILKNYTDIFLSVGPDQRVPPIAL